MLTLSGWVGWAWRGLVGGEEEGGGWGTRVWLDVEQEDGGPSGRLVIGLREDVAPKLCAHFRHLVTGDVCDHLGRRLHYKGSLIHAVYPDRGLLIGGDVVHGNGNGSVSLAAPDSAPGFTPDPRVLHFTRAGTLASGGLWDAEHRTLANSQFFIVGRALEGGKEVYPHSVPFAHVLHGLPLLHQLRAHPVSGRPAAPIRIRDCGLYA